MILLKRSSTSVFDGFFIFFGSELFRFILGFILGGSILYSDWLYGLGLVLIGVFIY